jgi:hypothetical protein
VLQVLLHNDAYNPAVKVKFTLPEPVPHGGVTTGSVLYIHPDGLTRRRFAAASNAALSSLASADLGQLDVFTTVTCVFVVLRAGRVGPCPSTRQLR